MATQPPEKHGRKRETNEHQFKAKPHSYFNFVKNLKLSLTLVKFDRSFGPIYPSVTCQNVFILVIEYFHYDSAGT